MTENLRAHRRSQRWVLRPEQGGRPGTAGSEHMGRTLVGAKNLPARTRDENSQPDEFPQTTSAMPKLGHTVRHTHAFLRRTGQPQAR